MSEIDAGPRSRIALILTGGTIAMAGESGAHPAIAQSDALADIAKTFAADITIVRASNKPSPHATFEDIRSLADLIGRLAQSGIQGVVITHGTDTLEDVAFVLELSIDVDIPVVITGAMRPADHPGADGAANLVAALRAAIHPDAPRADVLVVMHDEIHAARFATKFSASGANAFASPGLGPIGWISEGQPRFMLRPPQSPTVDWEHTPPEVVVATIGFAQEPASLRRLLKSPPAGLVVAGLGGGHVPPGWVEPLQQIAQTIPCILASRCPAGGSLQSTYDYSGSERDLLSRGLISSGSLPPSKARILLALLLSAAANREQITETFALY